MKCLMKDILFHNEDVCIINGHKHTLHRTDGSGGAVFLIQGGCATYGSNVEIDFGGWVERPSVEFMKREFGIDITEWRGIY